MIGALVAIELVTLHMIDGRVVKINPAAVQQLIEAHGPNRFMAEGVKCLIRMGGSYVTVKETCAEVQKLIEGNKP
jgi:hypothetical protein